MTATIRGGAEAPAYDSTAGGLSPACTEAYRSVCLRLPPRTDSRIALLELRWLAAEIERFELMGG